MQRQLNKWICVGVRPDYDNDTIEKTKLVNGISLVGVPVCILYCLLFGISGYTFHAISFAAGSIVFFSTLPFNYYFGLNFSRKYISVMAPICFGFVNVISGPESGFYMGFIVTTIPALLVFSNIKESVVFIFISILILILSLIGTSHYEPVTVLKFASWIHIINLFTVIAATLGVVFLFTKELKESRNKIEEKQKEILDSIHYAKRIQNTLITNKEFIDKNLPDNFILFLPKDIVSGDFYWATQHENRFYLAVCDSTGHGVPGAFMSLLNITFLNEAINQKHILEVDEIFNYTREKLIQNLGKEGQKDGFDGILICFDWDKKEISFVAANNPPILVTSGELKKLYCDKMPVGQGEKQIPFARQYLSAKTNDIIYLYTDGYADQFGGKHGKKLKYKALNEYILSISNEPLKQQHQLLMDRFYQWKGYHEQVDDVCIIGIHVPY